MPSDRVRAIAQGPDGLMWFGTEGGLAKFDGRRTQVIKDPALKGTRVLSLKLDADGALWIGTDAGAARMVEGRWQAINETSNHSISAIINPERGRVLMASEQGQIFEALTNGTAVQVRRLLDEPLQSSDRDQPGPLILTSLAWMGTQLYAGSLSRGLLRIENGTAREERNRQVGFFVRALNADKNSNLWVGTRARREEPGVSAGVAASIKRKDAPTGPVAAIQTIGDAVYVGSDGRGVFRFEGDEVERLTFDGSAGGLRSDRVYAIFEDREGVIWFGTDRGVSRFDPKAPRVETISQSAENNFVRTLLRSSGGVLVAGTNRGLFVYNDAARIWESVAALSRQIIYALSEDSSGTLLVGSASGFYVSQSSLQNSAPSTIGFTRVVTSSGNPDSIGSVRSIVNFRGSIYIASYGRGVEMLSNGRVRNIWPKEVSADVISLFADGDQRLLVGTAKDGVLVYNGEQVAADKQFDAAKGTAVRAITRTSDEVLWLATARGVMACPANGACWLIPNTGDARALMIDDKGRAIWCATTGAGLLKIAYDQDVGPVVSQIDAEQGLPSQNTFAIVANNESAPLLLGTNRGIVRYVPGNVPPKLYATRVLSKRVHSPAELSAGLSLEYPQNSLLLDVAAFSSRTFPEQFQYAFVLTDSTGKAIRQRVSRESQFAIEGLKPGTYRVTARAYTKDLVESAPLSFDLSIADAPFPWTSTALAVLLALTLLALLWALRERWRIVKTSNALVQANRELADARLNLANEAERERSRIARDLHDQTLADLRHLLLLTDQLPTNGGAGVTKSIDPSVLRGEIEGISQEVRRICEDLSPSVLQNVGFAAALEFALSHAVQHAPVDRRFEYEVRCEDGVEERTGLSSSVQMQIYRIAQEAVSNICRHASPQHVVMHVSASPSGDFLLRIEDDGNQFDPEKTKSDGLGLANMRARASLIDAEIRWEKRNGGGTVFTLRRSGRPERLEQ
ncbi:MAG TPA: two-component regulator propeller domain-containing protein [Pyrinomonadaceae bacterium]|nr:two-component regulator propeller domain-containing protein [Pyrinomonadaceae bacterium]